MYRVLNLTIEPDHNKRENTMKERETTRRGLENTMRRRIVFSRPRVVVSRSRTVFSHLFVSLKRPTRRNNDGFYGTSYLIEPATLLYQLSR
jgi:hypothetical protein